MYGLFSLFSLTETLVSWADSGNAMSQSRSQAPLKMQPHPHFQKQARNCVCLWDGGGGMSHVLLYLLARGNSHYCAYLRYVYSMQVRKKRQLGLVHGVWVSAWSAVLKDSYYIRTFCSKVTSVLAPGSQGLLDFPTESRQNSQGPRGKEGQQEDHDRAPNTRDGEVDRHSVSAIPVLACCELSKINNIDEEGLSF